MGAYSLEPRVEVGFGFGAYDFIQSGSWTDITDYCDGFDTQRGRDNELDNFGAGTASFTLDNSDRRFDPLNTSSPYVGLVKANVPIRVTAELSEPAWSFVDPFAGSALGPAWTVASGTPVVSGGNVTLDSGQAKIYLASESPTDRAMQVEWVTPQGTGTIEFGWRSGLGGADPLAFGFQLVGGTTTLNAKLNGTTVASATLSPTNHKYLRLRARDGTVYFERSSNGTAWTPIHSAAEPTWAGLAYPVLWVTAATVGSAAAEFRLGWVRAPVWRGLVDSWPAEYDEGGFNKTLELQCSDVFKVLGERPLPDTFVKAVEAITVDALADSFISASLMPVYFSGHFKMDSTRDAEIQNARNAYGKANAITGTNLEQGEGLVPVSTDALVVPEMRPPAGPVGSPVKEHGARIPMVKGSTGPTDLTSGNMIHGPRWSLAMVVQFRGRGAMGGDVYSLFTSTAGVSDEDLVKLSVDDSGALSLFVNGGGAGNLTITTTLTPGFGSPYTPVNVADGDPHRILAVRRDDQAFLFVDGALVASGTGPAGMSTITLPTSNHYIGRTGVGDGSKVWPSVAIDELMAWQQLALDDYAVELNDALTGFGELQLVSAAVGAVLDYIGWPAELRAIDPGETLVRLPGTLLGNSPLELLQRLADSEGGRLFIGADGKVVFHAADRFLREPTENAVQYAFTDTGADVGLDGAIAVVVNDDQVMEAAEVSRQDGEPQRAQSTDTPNKTYELSDLLFDSDLQALRRAERIVHLYAEPKPRTQSWDVWPEAIPGDWPDVLALDIGHRIGISLTPGDVGSALDLQQHLEYIEHNVTAEDWTVTMNGSPVDETPYLVWGGDGATQGWGNGAWR